MGNDMKAGQKVMGDRLAEIKVEVGTGLADRGSASEREGQ